MKRPILLALTMSLIPAAAACASLSVGKPTVSLGKAPERPWTVSNPADKYGWRVWIKMPVGGHPAPDYDRNGEVRT